MTVLNDTKIKIIKGGSGKYDLIYNAVDEQRNLPTLYRVNKKGGNDAQFSNVLKKYPEIVNKLLQEAIIFEPYISVIVTVENYGRFKRVFDSIFDQFYSEFELIVMNVGEPIKNLKLPTNFQLINFPGGSINTALNVGLRKSCGKYVLFKDESTYLDKHAVALLVQSADRSNADVVHFKGHKKGAKFITDDAPDVVYDEPSYFMNNKQIRADMWLNDKLSKRLDTKIFKRNFLIKK